MRKSALMLGLVIFAWGSVASATNLTGLINFSTSSSGTVDRQWVANTLPDLSLWNIYVDPDPVGGAFLNSGNGASVLLDISLSDGIHSFTLWADNSAASPHFSLNLFFNGDGTTPGISVFAPENGGTFAANSSSTLMLAGGAVPGAGTLSFIDGLTTVTLTNYSWGCCGGDRVQPFDNSPGRQNDMVGYLTLEVTTVPEPSTALLLATGILGLGIRRNRGSCRGDGSSVSS